MWILNAEGVLEEEGLLSDACFLTEAKRATEGGATTPAAPLLHGCENHKSVEEPYNTGLFQREIRMQTRDIPFSISVKPPIPLISWGPKLLPKAAIDILDKP